MDGDHRIKPLRNRIVGVYRAISVTAAAQRDKRRSSGVVAYAADGIHRVGALVEVLMTSKDEIDALTPCEGLNAFGYFGQTGTVR